MENQSQLYALSVYRRREPVYQCARCGSWVSIEKPLTVRLNGRLYVGGKCPNCGSFVGISLPHEARRVEFIPEEDKAAFEQKSGVKLDEGNRIQGADGYAVVRLRPALEDYVDMLAEQGTVILNGKLTELGKSRKEEILKQAGAGTGRGRWI